MAWWNKKDDDEAEETGSASSRVVDAVRNLYQRVVDNQRRAVEADQAVARETARQVTSAPKAVFNALDRATQSTTQANMAAQRAQTQRVQDAARNIYGAYQQQQERAARDQMAEQARQRQAQQQRMQAATAALYRQSQIQQQANRNQAETMRKVYGAAVGGIGQIADVVRREGISGVTKMAGEAVNKIPQALADSDIYNAIPGQLAKAFNNTDEEAMRYRLRQEGYSDSAIDAALEAGLISPTARYERQQPESFTGEFAANYNLGELSQQADILLGQGIIRGDQSMINRGMELRNRIAQYRQENQSAIEYDSGVVGNMLSRDIAQYLPQMTYQQAAALPAQSLALLGSLLGPEGAKYGERAAQAFGSGSLSFTTMAGAAYQDLIEKGADPETAARLAKDEAAISSAIESADTFFDVAFGPLKGLNPFENIGKQASKKLMGRMAIGFGKWAGNTGQEYAEEASQEMVSMANERRLADGNTEGGVTELLGYTFDQAKETVPELFNIWKKDALGLFLKLPGAKERFPELLDAYKGIETTENAERANEAGRGGAIIGGFMSLFGQATGAVRGSINSRYNRAQINQAFDSLVENTDAEDIGQLSDEDLTDAAQTARDMRRVDAAEILEAELARRQQPETVRETAPGNEGLRSEFAARVATEEGVPVPLEGIAPERQTVVEQAAQDIRNAAQQGMTPPIEQYNAPAQTQQRTPGLTLATEAGRLGDVEYDAVDYNTLNDTQRSIVDATGRMAEALGLDVTVINAAGNVGGAYQKGGKIYLNIASGMDLQGYSKAIAESSFAHELGHWMKDAAKNDAQAAADYQALQDMVLGAMSEDQLESLIQEKMAAEPKLTREGAIEEVVSDAIQPLLQDSKAFEQMARENPSLAQRILDFLKQFLDRIRDAFGEVDYSDNLPIYHAVQAIEDSLGEMQETYDRALLSARDYQQRRNEAERKQNIKDADTRVSSDVEQNLQTVDTSRQTQETDAEYMSAVEDGNAQVQERMVQESAMSAGAIEDPKRPGKPLKLYHGTPSFGFTVFNTPTIFTTDNPSISSGYGGNIGYADPRKISDVYTPDDGSFDTLKKNAKSIMGRSIRKATDADRTKIIDDLRKTAEQLQERLDKLWTDEATDVLYDVLGDETFTSEPDEYGYSREADYDNAWTYMNTPIWDMTGYSAEEILESYATEDIRSDIEKYFAYKDAFRRAISDHWDEIKGTPAEGLANFIRSFDIGDLAIDMRYSLLPSLREDAIVYEDTGKIGTEENLRNLIERQKDLGSYELYGFSGDNQLVVDCKGKIWYNLTVPGLAEDGTTTDAIMKKAKKAGYTSVLFKDLLDPAMNDYASNIASNVYVFFDSNQVKSADRVTYDDNGNVIPLSERFNRDNPDIRFQTWNDESSREDDQLANELTSTTEAAPEDEAPSEPAPAYNDGTMGLAAELTESGESEPAAGAPEGPEGPDNGETPAYNDGTMGLFGPTNEEQEAKAAEQAAKAGNDALNKYIEDLPDDPMDLYTKQQKVTAEKKGEERITTKKNPKKKTLRQKVSEGWHGFIRLMANDGDAIHQAGRQTGNKALDGMFFYAKAARQRAQDWVQGKRMSFGLDKTGDSLNSIFDPIRAKGDEYYRDFQLYLYHMLNVERMSRSTGDEVPALKDTLRQLRQKANRHGIDLGSMTDDELQRRAQAYKEGGVGGLYDEIGDLASQYWETKKDLMRAERQQNKPVFGWDEGAPDADESKKISDDLLAAHPEFEQEAQKVYDYIDDLLQYRVDAGLITQADMDNLKSIYPHYVPVMYDYEDAPQEIRKGGLTVSSTIKKAKGGDTTLLPLHYALARQTLSVMRNAGFQQLGGTVLGEYENSEELMGKWVQDVKESEAAWDPSMADNEVPQTRENVVTVFRDGKRYDMTLSPDMAYAFNSLQPSGENNLLGTMVGGANDLFKKLCTAYNPLFMITNPVRDVQDALFYSTDTKRWVKNYPLAWRQIAGNGKYWQMYKAMGGVYNSYFDWATGDSDGKKMGKVEMANLWIEQAPRLAEFMTVLENAERDHGSVTQEDRMEAFNAAAEITTNFSRSGKVGRFINRYVVPFWNPGVQGLSKVTRTLTETRGFKSWAGLALKAAALGIVPQILNGLLYRDDDEWDVIDDDMKANYYLFKGKDGVWIKIPKGRVLAALSTPVVGLMESARGDEVDWGALGTAAVSSVAPNNPLESTLLSTAMRADLFDPDSPGKTWYGGDIESKRLQGYAPGERYDESTDAISKWLGGKLDLSPKKLSYILDQYSGVLGDLVLPYLTPKAERGVYVGDYALPLSNAFMSRFTTDTVTSNTIGNEYYGLLDQLTWKANAGDDAAAMAKKYMNRAGGTVSDMYAQIRKIENDPNLSDKEKTTLTRELRKQLNAYEQQVTADAKAYLETAREYVDQHPEADYTDDKAVDAYVEGYNSTQTDEKNMITADDAARKMQDEVYREANRQHFGAEYALQVYNKDVFEKAQQANEDAGVSYDDYYDYYFGTRNLKSDKDENGKTISGSKKEKVVAYIDGMDIPDEQKDALYLASGYTENTLEDAPWNGGTGKYTGSSGSGSGRKKTPETRLKEYQDVQTKKAADPNYNPAADGHAWTVWADRAVESGIEIEDAIKHMTELGKFTADYDQYGKPITGSKKEKVVDYIQSQKGLTKAQKDMLYLYIYGENSLRFTPWHGWTGDKKKTGRRRGRRGGRRRSGGSTSRSVKQVGMLAKGYSTDGIDVSALFGVSGSGRSQTQNTSAASDLLEIINKHYGGNALAAAMDGGKRAKGGRTTVDFKL